VARAGAIGLVAIAVATTACAAHRLTLPSGAHVPAPDGAANLVAATSACRAARSFSATLTVSGHIGADSVPKLTVFAGATADGGIYLSASIHQVGIFTFGGTADRATLVLHQDNTTITAPADRILAELVHLKLSPSRWLALMTGCVTLDATASPTSADRYGNKVVVTLQDSTAVVESSADRWRVTGGLFDAVAVRYDAFAGDWPSRWTMSSTTGAADDVMLDIATADPHVNDPQVTTSGFTVTPPPSATTITLDQLRARGLKGK